MSIDAIKKRFVEEIKLRAYDDKYIDKGEEREILQIAIQLGVSIESARSALAQVCEESGFIVESKIISQIKDQVETAAGNDGMVDQKEFELIFGNIKKTVQGKKNDREVKKMIVTVMEETGNNKIKKGWFSNWYATLKADLGMS
jgi:microcompartment protein CcmL/EutN